jgi:hypothetical protein
MPVTGSQWFDNSANANKLRNSYLKGFLDISFNLSIFSFVKIGFYNAAGMLMQSLLNEDIKSVGLQKRSFKLKDVASGSYFIKLFINNEAYAYKIVVDR